MLCAVSLRTVKVSRKLRSKKTEPLSQLSHPVHLDRRKLQALHSRGNFVATSCRCPAVQRPGPDPPAGSRVRFSPAPSRDTSPRQLRGAAGNGPAEQRLWVRSSGKGAQVRTAGGSGAASPGTVQEGRGERGLRVPRAGSSAHGFCLGSNKEEKK